MVEKYVYISWDKMLVRLPEICHHLFDFFVLEGIPQLFTGCRVAVAKYAVDELFPYWSTAIHIQQQFFWEDVGIHFSHLHNLRCRIGAKLFRRLTKRFDPIVYGDMAAFQKPAKRTKPQAFKVKLKCLPLYIRTFSSILNGMPEITKITTITLRSFYNTIFHTFLGTAFWTNSHETFCSNLRPYDSTAILN